MQDSRFLNFIRYRWVKYQKFKGASAKCAILLNFLLLIFKVALCGVVLVPYLPHLAANKLLNQPTRSAWNRVLYVFLVIMCFAADALVLLCAAAVVVGGIECLREDQILTGLMMSATGGLIGWWSVKGIIFLFSRTPIIDEDEEEQTTEEETVAEEEDDLHFCQLFRLGEAMSLLVDHVEMCPDETAFIRVVDEEGYTPVYKRKVRRDRAGNRYLVFNSTNYYLNDEKTQPIVPKK